jgi:hypothetical protein
MICFSLPFSAYPWPIYLLVHTVQNLRNGTVIQEPPYYSFLVTRQREISQAFCDFFSRYQHNATVKMLRNHLPNELISKIIEYNKPSLSDLDCMTLQLQPTDHGKQMVTLFSLLSPEYVVVVHKETWIISFSREMFMMGMFIAGYASLLKYIWIL